MKAWFLAAALVAVTAHAEKIEVPDELAQACADGGGCVLIPQSELIEKVQQMMQEAFQQGLDKGRAEAAKAKADCDRKRV